MKLILNPFLLMVISMTFRQWISRIITCTSVRNLVFYMFIQIHSTTLLWEWSNFLRLYVDTLTTISFNNRTISVSLLFLANTSLLTLTLSSWSIFYCLFWSVMCSIGSLFFNLIVIFRFCIVVVVVVSTISILFSFVGGVFL